MAATPVRILIINPNTSQHMTEALKPAVNNLGYSDVIFSFFTSPSPGIPSINSPADAAESASVCLPHLVPLIPQHDAFLIACYSQHPLVPQLKSEIDKLSLASQDVSDSKPTHKYVTGIFEASANMSLSLVGSSENERFGIVSTGKVWEQALQVAVEEFVGGRDVGRFLGCKTTGLNASELHDLPAEEVRQKMMMATKQLLVGGKNKGVHVKAICLGCAGMVGLEKAVREACMEELGIAAGKQVSIVDGVMAGVGILYGLARCGF